MDLSRICVSPEETHHLLDDNPLYSNRYNWVLKYRPPGLAAARDESGAFHIDLNGVPTYENRFLRTFSFYYGLATVVTREGWGHINPSGELVYVERYAWTGNFQDRFCTVRDKDGLYFHICSNGKPAYPERYRYAGDYRNGIAVVQCNDGYTIHIDKKGKPINDHRFLDLDVFHKGYARARAFQGWFHVDKNGNPAYEKRFKMVEPFYNGFARVIEFSGRIGIIDETGNWIHTVQEPNDNELRTKLSGLLVDYWKSQTIYSGVKLGIIDLLEQEPKYVDDIARKCQLDVNATRKLVRGLAVLGVLKWDKDDVIRLSKMGDWLKTGHPEALGSAALIWGSEHYNAWQGLPESIKTGKVVFDRIYGKPFFDWLVDNPDKADIYHSAMSSYAKYDYKHLTQIHDFSKHKILMDVGGGYGILLTNILKTNSKLRGILLDTSAALKGAYEFLRNEGVLDRCQLIERNFFEELPNGSDAIIMSRVIHDWNDDYALKILKNCYAALPQEGYLYLVELITPDNPETDFGVLLNLNMLVITGGKERTEQEYKDLVTKGGFEWVNVIPTPSIVSLIVAKKTNDLRLDC